MATVAVITSAFRTAAEWKAEALGAAGLQAAVIDHPLAALKEDEIRQRARQAAPQIAAILTGARSEGEV